MTLIQTHRLKPTGDASRARKNECLFLHSEAIRHIQKVTEELHVLDKDVAIRVSDVTRNLIHSLILLRDISKRKASNQEMRNFLDRVVKRMAALELRLSMAEVRVLDENYHELALKYVHLRDYAHSTQSHH